MTETETIIAVVTSILCISTGAALVWTHLLARPKELPPTRWRCPFKGPKDFSGGYRDSALNEFGCGYTLEMYCVPNARPRCPDHHIDLITGDYTTSGGPPE